MDFLQSGHLAGKILCPNAKCKAKLGNYYWAGAKCRCWEWVTPVSLINLLDVETALKRWFWDNRDSAFIGRRWTRYYEPSARTGDLYVTRLYTRIITLFSVTAHEGTEDSLRCGITWHTLRAERMGYQHNGLSSHLEISPPVITGEFFVLITMLINRC
jgi:hypothetical protein